MTAREEFNKMLNSCYNPRATYNALLAFATTPNIQKAENMIEKRSVIITKANIIANQSCADESIKEAV